jgi:hypothetical protein
MRRTAILLALLFWTAPLIGAISLVCVCEHEGMGDPSLAPVSCCADETQPCCFVKSSTHGGLPLVSERGPLNRLDWNSGVCLTGFFLSAPVLPWVLRPVAKGLPEPAGCGVAVRSRLQVWLI